MLSDKFREVTGDGWTTAGLDVQFKVVERVLYLQCTHGWSDWAFNFFAAKVEYEEHGVKVVAHAGFAALWLSIRDEIEKLDFDTIVSYSEGSAIAQAIHLNYFTRKGVQPKTYAFAAPRYFARNKGDDVRNSVSGIVYIQNPVDLVTHVPFLSMGFTRYPGKTITLKQVRRPKGERLLRFLSGHSPEQYTAALAVFDKK